MKHLKTIVGINLVIILVYSVLIRIAAGGGTGNDKNLGILFFSAFVIAIHVITCLIITGVMYSKSNDLGKAWLLSSGIVLLVGFSSCLGNASL